EFATAWAQAETPIPCFGTTHADYFHGPVPVTERLSAQEIAGDYELETGAADAAHSAVILEYVARMACHTLSINTESRPLARELHDKHFLRKHGRNAYYGQVKTQ